MSQTIRCPKCGKEMREGELFIKVASSGGVADQYMSRPAAFPTGSSLGAPIVVTGEGPFWRERTGEKKGFLVKKEQMQTLKISGLRCIACGYIELYTRR